MWNDKKVAVAFLYPFLDNLNGMFKPGIIDSFFMLCKAI